MVYDNIFKIEIYRIFSELLTNSLCKSRCMIFLLLQCSVLAECNITLSTSMGPILYNSAVSADTTICLNTTSSYLGVIFNHWDGTIVYAHRFKPLCNKTYGPYTSNGRVGGLDFGRSLRSSVDIYVKQDTILSFSAVNFDPKAHLRILSNHPDDLFSFGNSQSSDKFYITSKPMMQYFNGAPGHRRYHVDMNVGTGDNLQFCKDSSNCKNFSGKMKFSRTDVDNTHPEIITWSCQNSDHDMASDYMSMEIKSDFDTKVYSRLVTNTNHFTEIPVLELPGIHKIDIAILICLSVLVIASIFGLPALYFQIRKRNGKRLRSKEETDYNTESVTESLGLI